MARKNGTRLGPYEIAAPIEDMSFNRGTHVLHFGGEYDPHFLVPQVWNGDAS
jgi:hypothetical protein